MDKPAFGVNNLHGWPGKNPAAKGRIRPAMDECRPGA
jgi:hypothetical protein